MGGCASHGPGWDRDRGIGAAGGVCACGRGRTIATGDAGGEAARIDGAAATGAGPGGGRGVDRMPGQGMGGCMGCIAGGGRWYGTGGLA